jgi:hypothetical protein
MVGDTYTDASVDQLGSYCLSHAGGAATDEEAVQQLVFRPLA